MIIERPDLINDLGKSKWVLVYGRRKTGKTFLVSNYSDFDEFFFVKRDRTIISKKDLRSISYDTLIELVKRDLRDEKTVVIDEFHRLGPDLLDNIHSLEISGRLILISSTLHLSHQLISGSSPLLGKVSELMVPLISYRDLLSSHKGEGKQYYEMMAFLKEPLVISLDLKDPVDIIRSSMLTVPALVGEIFTEEDRKISSTYEGILRSISTGKESSGDITSYLFARNLIKKDDQSIIQQYANNLMNIGLIRRIKVWNRKKFIYKLNSPMVKAHYFLDEKYNITEREVPRKEMKDLTSELIPHIMEDLLRNSLAEITGCQEQIDHSSNDEVDGILIRFKRPWAVIEVKWKDRLKKKDIESIKKKLNSYDVERRFLIVPDRTITEIEGVEVIEPNDLLDLL